MAEIRAFYANKTGLIAKQLIQADLSTMIQDSKILKICLHFSMLTS